MENQNDYLSLSEIAKKWHCSEIDVLSMAEEEKLILSVKWAGMYSEKIQDMWTYRGPLNDFVDVGLITVVELIDNMETNFPICCNKRNGKEIELDLPETSEYLKISRTDIVISAKEVQQFENDNPDILKTGSNTFINRHNENSCSQTPMKTQDGTTLRNPEGSIFLTGWKDIASYMKVCEQTARTYAKKGNWLRYNESGKPITTTYEVDKGRALSATKKKLK